MCFFKKNVNLLYIGVATDQLVKTIECNERVALI